jgi:hypothetical protein
MTKWLFAAALTTALAGISTARANDGCGPGCHTAVNGGCVVNGWESGARVWNECPAGGPSAATLRRWLCLEPIDEGLHAQVSFRSARRKGRRRAAQPISHHAAGAGPASRTHAAGCDKT